VTRPSQGLTRARVAAYAAPALPLAAMYFPVFVFLAEFYATAHGLPLGAIGTVFIAARLFDAVSDPVAGIASDRWSTRWGRRRPWLAAGAPLVMLSAWVLFVPGPAASLTGFAVWLFLLTLGWTVMLTPYLAWGAELTGDYAERGRVSVWRETAGLVGTILAAVLYSLGADAAEGMRNVALFILLTMPVACAFCLALVPEPRNFSRVSASLGSLARVLTGEPLFGRLILAFFVNSAANALPAGLFLFFVGQRLGAPAWGGPLLIVYFGSAALAAPLWPWLVRRYPKHRVWCWAMLYACVVFAGVLLLREGDAVPFTIICVLSGAALGADLSLPTAIQADVIDLDTARSGDQRTGAFFAVWSLAQKLALAGSGGAALIVLGWIGFSAGGGNTPAALTGLSLLYALAPIVLKLGAVGLMWGFPLGAEAQRDLRRQIERGA
jgi:glycoside/pentoside/hexuronide:cation symporter, GPH family